jgi:hypothetical protein
MSSGEYFRRQSELCLQLAKLTDERVAARLVQMAEDFDSRARLIEVNRVITPCGWGSQASSKGEAGQRWT